MMVLQRNRAYELIIGNYQTGDGLLINNLQITFDISKSSSNKDKTNSAAIEIYNLSDESLKLIDNDYPAAVFSAGYVDTGGVKRLFSGQVTNVTTKKAGTDRVTQITMGNGYTDLNHDVMSSLVAPGRTVRDVAEEIRKALPNASRGVYNGTNLNNQIIYGYPLMGTPKEMLDELSEKYQIDWQLEDDVLYVHDSDRGNSENFEEAYVVSKYTGLIENAYRVTGDRRRSKKDPIKKQSTQWKMLLNPDLQAGDIVKLEDTLLTGWYRVDDIRHTGSFRGNEWFTEIRATALEKVVRS
jgi:hypothetical protein